MNRLIDTSKFVDLRKKIKESNIPKEQKIILSNYCKMIVNSGYVMFQLDKYLADQLERMLCSNQKKN